MSTTIDISSTESAPAVQTQHPLAPFICGACDQVLNNPHSRCAKEHAFCYNCIAHSSTNRCATCGEISKILIKNVWLARTIKALVCPCRFVDRGCSFTGPALKHNAHYGSVYSADEGCQYRDFKCMACSQIMEARDFKNHGASCANVTVPCPRQPDGCMVRAIMRKNVDTHLAEKCKYVPCGKEFDLTKALGTEMIYRCAFVGNGNRATKHNECQKLVDAIEAANASKVTADKETDCAFDKLREENIALKAEVLELKRKRVLTPTTDNENKGSKAVEEKSLSKRKRIRV